MQVHTFQWRFLKWKRLFVSTHDCSCHWSREGMGFNRPLRCLFWFRSTKLLHPAQHSAGRHQPHTVHRQVVGFGGTTLVVDKVTASHMQLRFSYATPGIFTDFAHPETIQSWLPKNGASAYDALRLVLLDYNFGRQKRPWQRIRDHQSFNNKPKLYTTTVDT